MKSMRSPFVSTMLLLLTLTAASALRAQPEFEWEENAQFAVQIGGAYDLDAQVFQPTSHKPWLILQTPKLDGPVFIDLTAKKVFLLKKGDLRVQESFAWTKGIPSGSDAGGYTVKGQSSVFTVKGKKVSLTMRQTIVGEVAPAAILAHSPEYSVRMKAYKPKQAAIKKLAAYKKPTEVVVMFATWCSTCKVVLPAVLRVFDDAKNKNFSVKYIGIAMGGQEPRAALEKHGHDYPAVIFYQNGKEVNRVIGDPPGAIEELFLTILK